MRHDAKSSQPVESPAHRVCPVELAGSLENRLRKLIHNPRRLLGPYLRPGMTVLDLGCGPGFFTATMAELVGPSGRVIAADLQEGMLQKLKEKIAGTKIEPLVTLHKCEVDRVGVAEPIDFVFAFFALHEIPNHPRLFSELAGIVKPGGRIFVVEPKYVHVSAKSFAACIAAAESAGLGRLESPRVFLGQSVLLGKV